jgi:hypothetical protein
MVAGRDCQLLFQKNRRVQLLAGTLRPTQSRPKSAGERRWQPIPQVRYYRSIPPHARWRAPMPCAPGGIVHIEHCPSGTVAWLNLPSGVYHFKGQRSYGYMKNGAYVCKKEPDQAGDRATRSGQ